MNLYIKNIIPFLFVLVFSCSVYSQSKHPRIPYEPLEFIGLDYLWYEQLHSDAKESDICDGYNNYKNAPLNIDPIIHNDRIYFVWSIKDALSTEYGVRIECRSLDNGKVVWYQEYELPDNEKLEYARFLSIEDDKLVYIGLKRVTDYLEDGLADFFYTSLDTRMVYRTFDLENGDEIERIEPDMDDQTLEVLTANILTDRQYAYFNFDGNNIRYTCRHQKYPTDSIITFSLNKDGRRISQVDTIITSEFLQVNCKMQRIENDYNFEVREYREDSTGSIIFNTYNSAMELVESVEADTLGIIDNWLGLLNVNEDRVVLSNLVVNSPFEVKQYEIGLYERSGALIKQGSLVGLDDYLDHFEPINWETGEDIYLIATAYRISSPFEGSILSNFMDILKSNDSGSFDIVKRYELENGLRYPQVLKVTSLSKGRFLLNLWETNIFQNGSIFEVDWHANPNSEP